MRTFASVDTFVESSQKSLKLGRLVANFEFFQALLRHGTFDRYHLFCPSAADMQTTRAAFERLPGIDPGRLAFSTHLELPSWLAREDFDVFHVGGWSHYLPRLAWLRARYARRPFVASGVIHSLNTPEIPARFRQFLDAPLGPMDSVICTTHAGREVFMRYIEATRNRLAAPEYAGRLDVIPFGVSEPYFAPRDRAECRRRLGLPAPGVHILYLGRISAHSKADLAPLLYCFRALLDRPEGERDLRLVLSGGGDEATIRSLRETAAELGIGDRLIVRQNIEDDEKLLLYGAADIFVSPIDNHQETFGISIVEAMAAGLPVVASDFDGYRELVQDGETGYRIASFWARPPEAATTLRGILEPNVAQLLVSQGVALDQRQLFDRLARLADQPDLRRRLGTAARMRALAEFTWSAVIARYESHWAELGRTASAAPWPPAAGTTDPDIVDLFDVFGHYPTAMLASSDMLALAPLAESVLAGRIPMPATYEDIAPLCDGRAMTLIVYALREKPRPLEELASLAAAKLQTPADVTRYVVLWLMKYGLVEPRG